MATSLEIQMNALLGVPVVIREPPRRDEPPFPVDSYGRATIGGFKISVDGSAICAGCGYLYRLRGKPHGDGPCFCATEATAGR
jgi:hypothetical protein